MDINPFDTLGDLGMNLPTSAPPAPSQQPNGNSSGGGGALSASNDAPGFGQKPIMNPPNTNGGLPLGTGLNTSSDGFRGIASPPAQNQYQGFSNPPSGGGNGQQFSYPPPPHGGGNNGLEQPVSGGNVMHGYMPQQQHQPPPMANGMQGSFPNNNSYGSNNPGQQQSMQPPSQQPMQQQQPNSFNPHFSMQQQSQHPGHNMPGLNKMPSQSNIYPPQGGERGMSNASSGGADSFAIVPVANSSPYPNGGLVNPAHQPLQPPANDPFASGPPPNFGHPQPPPQQQRPSSLSGQAPAPWAPQQQNSAPLPAADPWSAPAPFQQPPPSEQAQRDSFLNPPVSAPSPGRAPPVPPQGMPPAPPPPPMNEDPWGSSYGPGGQPPPPPAAVAPTPPQVGHDPFSSNQAIVPAVQQSNQWSVNNNPASVATDPFGNVFNPPPSQPSSAPAPLSTAIVPAETEDFDWDIFSPGPPASAPEPAPTAIAAPPPSDASVISKQATVADETAGSGIQESHSVPGGEIVERHSEENLPSGGEWYDARIFTPTLGVMFFKPQELTDSLFLNTDRSIVDSLDERPVVAFIVEGSSARSAGVELGHVLIKVNDIDVRNPKEASRLIKEGPRPLPLLFYVPATTVVVAEGDHMVKYDTRDTTAPNSAKDWKPKYVVVGGIIAQPWMINMYRSKSEYDIAVIETQARRPVSVKVKQFNIRGAKIQNDWQGPQMVKYKNKLHPWRFIVVNPVARNPIKISAPNLTQLKPVHEGIRRVLVAQQREAPAQHAQHHQPQGVPSREDDQRGGGAYYPTSRAISTPRRTTPY